MPVIIPPTYLYFNSDEDDGAYGGGFDNDLMTGISLGMILSVLFIIPCFAYLEYKDSPSKIYEKELKPNICYYFSVLMI